MTLLPFIPRGQRRIGSSIKNPVDPTERMRKRLAWVLGGGAGLLILVVISLFLLLTNDGVRAFLTGWLGQQTSAAARFLSHPRPALETPLPSTILSHGDVILSGQDFQPTLKEVVASPPRYDSAETPSTGPSSEAQAASRQIMDRFLATTSLESKARLCLNPGRTLSRMRVFYEGQKSRDPFLKELLQSTSSVSGHQSLVHLMYASPDRSSGVVVATFHMREAGTPLLDWESFVAFGEMTLAELKVNKPVTPVRIRVMAQASQYYNYEFEDPATYLSVRLSTPDGNEPILHGYAPLTQLPAEQLQQALNFNEREVTDRSSMEVPVVLRVRFLPNSESNRCLVIDEAICGRWLLTPNEDP